MLSTLATVSTAGAAGCGDLPGNDVELLRVDVHNSTGDPRGDDTRIVHQGETIHETTVELDANDAEPLDCEWPREPGAFVVSRRLDGDGEWTGQDVSDIEADCVDVVASVTDRDELRSLTGEGCDPPGETC